VLETSADTDVAATHKLLPFSFAKRHGVLIREFGTDSADVAHRPGASPLSLAEVRRFAGVPLKLSRVSTEVFDALLQSSYEHGSHKAMQMVDGLNEDIDLDQVAQELQEPSDLLDSDDDAPIIRFINAVLTEAVKDNASDVHIEPYENRLGVRFRVDGVLREVLQTRRALAPLVVSRIKVMSKLDIAEKRLPQDGRISLRIAGRAVDVRVSTIPSGHGERVVLRLLDKQAGRLDLKSLGMDDASCQKMDDLIHKPHGIILVTGPTGSGKTTTLYAALQKINTIENKILTAEDPVESDVEGIIQLPIRENIGLTFASALRSFLRQDPDIIMVGEIRDLDTAQIAIQASLTGHLVFSTLHTNDAASAITRLVHMSVEPYLISAALNMVLAQRLVRRVCPKCREQYEPPRTLRRALERMGYKMDAFYKGVGCRRCRNTGFAGRCGVHELLIINDELRDAIVAGRSITELRRIGVQSDMITLQHDGFRKVREGITTVEEILHIVGDINDLPEVKEKVS